MKLNEIYYGLQDCFIKIRHYSFADCEDDVLFETTVENIKNYVKTPLKTEPLGFGHQWRLAF